jgi:hypothetical protein
VARNFGLASPFSIAAVRCATSYSEPGRRRDVR